MIRVVSAMGLEHSGLALAVDRYCDALTFAGMTNSGWLLSQEQHPEEFRAEYATLSDLTRTCRPGDVVLWVGLADDDRQLCEQLACLTCLAHSGTTNLLIPERTLHPEADAYTDCIDVCRRGLIAGLVHFNSRQDRYWRQVVPLPSVVAAPPVPDQLFKLGASRQFQRRLDDFTELVYVGRLTRRKRVRELVAAWEESLQDSSRLHIFGRAFPSEPEAADFLQVDMKRMRSRLRWTPRFPSHNEILSFGACSIAVSWSGQEFDGIALSELIALGMPAVVSANEGHRSLAEETTAVTLCDSVDQWCREIRRLIADPEQCVAAGCQGARDIARHRSTPVIARRLTDLLSSL